MMQEIESRFVWDVIRESSFIIEYTIQGAPICCDIALRLTEARSSVETVNAAANIAELSVQTFAFL